MTTPIGAGDLSMPNLFQSGLKAVQTGQADLARASAQLATPLAVTPPEAAGDSATLRSHADTPDLSEAAVATLAAETQVSVGMEVLKMANEQAGSVIDLLA